jgi:hypothetical protein
MASAFLEFGLCSTFPDSTGVGATSHDESAVATHIPANERHFTVGLVGGNRDIGGSEGKAFSQANQSIPEVSTSKFCLVQLGIKIVMVEDESHAKELEEEPDQENRVWRITRLEDTEACAYVDTERQEQLGGERQDVLDKIP